MRSILVICVYLIIMTLSWIWVEIECNLSNKIDDTVDSIESSYDTNVSMSKIYPENVFDNSFTVIKTDKGIFIANGVHSVSGDALVLVTDENNVTKLCVTDRECYIII